MKSIILSVSPQEALNILNGKQTALLRKRVPKGFVGWCYLYVSKGEHLVRPRLIGNSKVRLTSPNFDHSGYDNLNSTIPARFWWEDAEQIKSEIVYNGVLGLDYRYNVYWGSFGLEKDEFENYIGEPINEIKGITDYKAYFIQVKNLEIFDEPKVLGEFKKYASEKDLKYCFEDSDCEGCKFSKKELECKLLNINSVKNYIYVEEME